MDNAVLTAVIGAIAGFAGSVPVAFLSYRLAVRTFERQYRLQTNIQYVLSKMLLSQKWDKRSFKTIKSLFPGIEEDELRKALIEAGAVQVGNGEREMWSHVSRGGFDHTRAT